MIFQDQCIKAIEAILNSPLDYKCGTADFLLKTAIANYCEEIKKGNETFRYWALNYNTKKNHDAWKYLPCSTAAKEIILYMIENKISLTNIKKQHVEDLVFPYYEHLSPRSDVMKRLRALTEPTEENIRKVLQQEKLALITKAESKILDNQHFTDLDKKVLESFPISDPYVKEAIESLYENGQYASCQKFGTSLARLVHLMNNGIKFEWLDKPLELNYESLTTFLNSGFEL